MLKKMLTPPRLTVFEWVLWITSITVTTVLYFIYPADDALSLVAALFGFTCLIFIAKGAILGQLLCVIFATLYGIVSLRVGYYGEMLTYILMSAPVAVMAIISWAKHPFKETNQVAVRDLRRRDIPYVLIACVLVTTLFHFVLRWLGCANLAVSTVSVATSFFAASLAFLRCPWFSLGYIANDTVLIVLWSLMLPHDRAALSMIACFSLFLLHDLYGLISWQHMKLRQRKALQET